jgi:DNA-directed RNA polymerase specialized sigma24 family protein
MSDLDVAESTSSDLQDLINRLHQGDESARRGLDQADTTYDPGRLAQLTEFHEQIENLPDNQRTIFELHDSGGFAQAEIAQMLKLPVSRSAGSGWPRRRGWPDGWNNATPPPDEPE